MSLPALARKGLLVLLVGSSAAHALCIDDINNWLDRDTVFVRRSLIHDRYYLNIEGDLNTERAGTNPEGYRITISGEEFETLRNHSPLGEILQDLKRRVPAEMWTDTFSLSMHLPFLNWGKHPILKDVPQFVRDEVTHFIRGTRVEFKKRVAEIAGNRTLTAEEKMDQLKKLSQDWVKKVRLQSYLDNMNDVAEAREKFIAGYRSGEHDFPEWVDPKEDVEWYSDFCHPIDTNGREDGNAYLMPALTISPERSAIIAFFRAHPDLALDYSQMMFQLGEQLGTQVLKSAASLDLFKRLYGLTFGGRKAAIELMVRQVRDGDLDVDLTLLVLTRGTSPTVELVFDAVGQNLISLSDAEDFILSSYFAQHGMPVIKQIEEFPMFLKALRGEIDPSVLAWARIHEPIYGPQSPGLKQLFDRILSSDQSDTAHINVDDEYAASILWYPRYPGGHYSWTHTKIVVNGQVYGTMGEIEPMKPYRVHARRARASLKDSFYKFDIQVTGAELLNLIYLTSNRERIAVNDHWGCVHGTCGTFAAATSMKIPPPFNQLPSLTALYLTMRKAFGDQRVKNIQFVGKSQIRSLLSPDIAADLWEVVKRLHIPAGGFVCVLIGGVVYAIHSLDQIEKDMRRDREEDRKKEEERRRKEEADFYQRLRLQSPYPSLLPPAVPIPEEEEKVVPRAIPVPDTYIQPTPPPAPKAKTAAPEKKSKTRPSPTPPKKKKSSGQTQSRDR